MKLEKVELESLKLDIPVELASSDNFFLHLSSLTFPENHLVMNVSKGIPASFLVDRPEKNVPILQFDKAISDPRLIYAFRLSHAQRLLPVESLVKYLGFAPEFPVSWSAYFAKAQCPSLFPEHKDNHDVFIFQLFGERLWKAGGNKLHLRPGNLLKIPRGIEHVVLETMSDSLHITVGHHI